MSTQCRSVRRIDRMAAFTLVELLVVIGIISLLISILLPSLARARASAVSLQCMSNLRQWGLGMQQYANDFKGMVPLTSDWQRVLGTSKSGNAITLWQQLLNETSYVPGGGAHPSGDRIFAVGGIGICPAFPTLPIADPPDPGWMATWSSTYASNGLVDYNAPAGLGLNWRSSFAPVKKIKNSSSVMLVTEVKRPESSQVSLVDPDQNGNSPQYTLAQYHPNKSSSVLFADGHVESMVLKSFGGWSHDYNAEPDLVPYPWKVFP